MRSTLSHALRSAAAPDRPDGQLLDLFARHRDEEAFAAVVRRHGPMVLGVCRRVLGNRADADDAFQATFLVLARKATVLGGRDALAGWLHGVAVNVARKLRHMNAKRKARERRAAGPPPAPPADDLLRDELLAALDEELTRLPETYRAAVVLCDLEGATRKEAACRLGCPEGTVAGRLARARALLAARLAGRGLALAGGVLVGQAAEAVPPQLFASAILAATTGPIPARVAAVTEGVMKAMLLRKIRAATALLVFGALAVTGAGVSRVPADDKPLPAAAPGTTPAPPAKPGDRKLTVVHLRSLVGLEAARSLSEQFPIATVSAVPGENTLLVYAHEPTTREIEAALRKLGEPPPKVGTVIPLKGATSAGAAKVLGELFGRDRATFVPVSGENALIVYATEADTLTVRKLLGQALDAPVKVPPAAKPVPAPQRFPVALQDQPWDKVFAWYESVSGLTYIGTTKPPGTFTYNTPPGVTYSVAEITDILNDALMAQKFILIRRVQSFSAYPADEKLPPDTVPRVTPEDLNRRGRTELVQVMLPLTASREFNDMLLKLLRQETGPFGAVEAFGPDHILVTDMAGRARQLRNLLADVNARSGKGFSVERIQTIPLKQTQAADVAAGIKKHFHPALKVAVTYDAATNSVVLEGDPLALAMLADMVRKLDAPPPAEVEKLTAEVEYLKERVALAERMVKRQFMTQEQVQAERL